MVVSQIRLKALAVMQRLLADAERQHGREGRAVLLPYGGREIDMEVDYTDADIGRALGASPATVAAWRARRQVPRGQRARRLVELSALVERLVRVLEPEYVPVWLNKPMPALDDDKPIDRIADGDYRSVSRIIAELESPTF